MKSLRQVFYRQLNCWSVVGYFMIFVLLACLPIRIAKYGSIIQFFLCLLFALLLLWANNKESAESDAARTFTAFRKKKNFSPKLVMASIAWGLLILGTEVVVLFIIYEMNHVTFYSSNTERVIQTIKQYPFYVLYTIAVAPILEELVFRKSLYSVLYKWLPSWRHLTIKMIVASLITAFIFALMHNDNSLIEYIVISLYLEALYLHYQDIRVSIIAHLTFNAVTLGILLLI